MYRGLVRAPLPRPRTTKTGVHPGRDSLEGHTTTMWRSVGVDGRARAGLNPGLGVWPWQMVTNSFAFSGEVRAIGQAQVLGLPFRSANGLSNVANGLALQETRCVAPSETP
jgi:hypothetical protein